MAIKEVEITLTSLVPVSFLPPPSPLFPLAFPILTNFNRAITMFILKMCFFEFVFYVLFLLTVQVTFISSACVNYTCSPGMISIIYRDIIFQYPSHQQILARLATRTIRASTVVTKSSSKFLFIFVDLIINQSN